MSRSIKVVQTSKYEGDASALPTFDNTKLVAINTCPLWGLVRYEHHKTMNAGNGRAMALEAGAAAHEVFAAHRLYTFMEYGAAFYRQETRSVERVYTQNGDRIFGKERFAEMCGAVDPREDFRTRRNQFSLTALYNCGFYDDPADRKRTMTNIEEMCIAYMDRHDWSDKLPVWQDDFLAIEIPVDVVITITEDDAEYVVRFIGKADAVHWTNKDQLVMRVHENKTASRLGDAWEMSWETNHQPTGYMIALSTMFDRVITEAEMLGTCLPMPKSYSLTGLARVVVRRQMWQFDEWVDWVLHTLDIFNKYKNSPTDAPMYTHSCNRYFRPCSFIMLCAEEPEARRETFLEMHHDEWSPLHLVGDVTDE